MPRGKFITFEGIDGCGKSTQARLLLESLRARGIPCELYREPGGTPLGEAVRALLLGKSAEGPGHVEFGRTTELLLFSAARAEIVRQVIRPALEAGTTIILDRFIDSTIAYQGYARRIDLSTVASLNRVSTDGLMPDVTFLLDVSPETGYARIGGNHDRMEAEGLEFMRKVREGYLETQRRDPERIMLLDGNRSVAELSHEIQRSITSLFHIPSTRE